MHTLPMSVWLGNSSSSLLLAMELDINDPEVRRYMGIAVACLFSGLALRVTCGLFNMLLKPGAVIVAPNILKCILVVILAWAINFGIVWGLSKVSPEHFVKLLDFVGGRRLTFQEMLSSVFAVFFGVGLLQALLIRIVLGARFGYGIVIAMLNMEVTMLLMAILGAAFSVWIVR